MYSKKAITQLFSWMSKTNVYVHVNMMHELHYSITYDTPETTRICKSLSNWKKWQCSLYRFHENSNLHRRQFM